MHIRFEDISLFFQGPESSIPKGNYIFFIHGFTGSSLDWKEIIPFLNDNFQCITLDLIGHGNSDSPKDVSYYSSDSINSQLKLIVEHISDQPIILAGYSMGGRVALNFAIENPSFIKALILESTTAGIKEEHLRIERISQDEKLASFIKNNSIEKFIDYWMNIDLFSTQKKLTKKKLEISRNQKLQNNKIGLINCLKGFGTGKMTPLYERLSTFYPETLLINGELDKKFCDINTEMANILPSVKHEIIRNCGHNTHFEQPKLFIEEINNFLREF